MSSMLTPLELDVAHDVIRARLAEAERDALADQLRRAHSTRPVAGSSSPSASAALRRAPLVSFVARGGSASASAAPRRGLPLPLLLPQALAARLSAPLPQPRPRPSAKVAVRHWLARGLRDVATRLDPSASVADASLVVVKAR